MNHKRKGPKSTRAGCLMCKPHKRQGNNGTKLDTNYLHRGFGKVKGEIHQILDMGER